jgi:hypothetical protein
MVERLLRGERMRVASGDARIVDLEVALRIGSVRLEVAVGVLVEVVHMRRGGVDRRTSVKLLPAEVEKSRLSNAELV